MCHGLTRTPAEKLVFSPDGESDEIFMHILFDFAIWQKLLFNQSAVVLRDNHAQLHVL
jgi:hypothetical protein